MENCRSGSVLVLGHPLKTHQYSWELRKIPNVVLCEEGAQAHPLRNTYEYEAN